MAEEGTLKVSVYIRYVIHLAGAVITNGKWLFRCSWACGWLTHSILYKTKKDSKTLSGLRQARTTIVWGIGRGSGIKAGHELEDYDGPGLFTCHNPGLSCFGQLHRSITQISGGWFHKNTATQQSQGLWLIFILREFMVYNLIMLIKIHGRCTQQA